MIYLADPGSVPFTIYGPNMEPIVSPEPPPCMAPPKKKEKQRAKQIYDTMEY